MSLAQTRKTATSTAPARGAISFIVASQNLVRDRYVATLIEAISHAANSARRALVLQLLQDVRHHDAESLLADPMVEGYILSAPTLGDALVDTLLERSSKPVALIGQVDIETTAPTIDVENEQSSTALVGHLLDTKCVRVAMITGPIDRVDVQQRIQGFRLAHAKRGLAVDEDLIVHGDYTRDSGYRSAKRLLPMRPDGIFAANDDMALGAALAASEENLVIPRDLSLAGFDGFATDMVDGPRLTTVEQPLVEIASTAVTNLLALLKGHSVDDLTLLTPKMHLGWSSHLGTY